MVYTFFKKNLVKVVFLQSQIINLKMNFIGRLLENLREEKFIHLLETIFDLADMQSLSKYNKGIRYLLCSIDFFSKYAWAVPLKDKRGITVVNVFQNIIPKGRKPNNIWFDQCGKFYNYLFKRFLKNVQWRNIYCCWKIYYNFEKQSF